MSTKRTTLSRHNFLAFIWQDTHKQIVVLNFVYMNLTKSVCLLRNCRWITFRHTITNPAKHENKSQLNCEELLLSRQILPYDTKRM